MVSSEVVGGKLRRQEGQTKVRVIAATDRFMNMIEFTRMVGLSALCLGSMLAHHFEISNLATLACLARCRSISLGVMGIHNCRAGS